MLLGRSWPWFLPSEEGATAATAKTPELNTAYQETLVIVFGDTVKHRQPAYQTSHNSYCVIAAVYMLSRPILSPSSTSRALRRLTNAGEGPIFRGSCAKRATRPDNSTLFAPPHPPFQPYSPTTHASE
jgi:hypothetical protein